jgi:hypothetical protein
VIGHSLGADATIQIANALDQQNIPIELIVTFDATHPHQVPKNVLHLVNFYQNNGFGKRISPGPGFKGELTNFDLTADKTCRMSQSTNPTGCTRKSWQRSKAS